MYTGLLAIALAEVLCSAIDEIEARDEFWREVDTAGLENILVNQAALEASWKTEKVWSFRKPSHINIQESVSVLKLAEHVAKLRKPLRVVSLVDSNVVRCALSKGRSSSLGLTPVICKFGAVCTAAGLYFCLPFCPTRLNPADDPTRDVEVRQGTSSARALDLSIGELHQLAGCKALRRWAANWFRLVLIVCGKEVIYFKQKNLFRACPYLSLLPARQCEPTMEFDQTLGFPGEGPRALEFFCLLLFVGLPIKEPGSVSLSWTFAAISVGPNVAMAAPVEPRNAGDWKRATLRQGREPLPQGRPVLKITEKQREVLLEKFRVWLLGKGVIAAELFADTYHHVEEINCLLSMYGRELYKAGRPLAHYSETINAISSWKPQLRRVLQGSWDLAYSWVRSEPVVHHTAMPPQVLLACVTCCLTWGWARVAGCLALAWAGLLRAGEIFQSKRQDLQLPSDLGGTTPFILLAINEPKTRFSAARHQAAKVDIPDVISVCELAFRSLPPSAFLWPLSPQTLRVRFKAVCKALQLPDRFSQACDH